VTPGQYAAHRGQDLKSIKQAVAEGRIDATPDGQIADPAEADRQWAERTRPRSGGPGNGNGHDADPTLAEATRRRTMASIVDLEAEVEALRAGSIEPVEVQKILREFLGPIAARIRAIPPRTRGLDAEVGDALSELSSAAEEIPPVRPRPRPNIATAAALASYRTSLLAERMEYATALRRGELVRASDVAAEIADRLIATRSLLLNLGAAVVTDADVPAEVERILHELCSPPTLHPILLFEEPRASGHDPGVTAAKTSGGAKKMPRAAKKTSGDGRKTPRRAMTMREQMDAYNERVEVAIGLGLTGFRRLGARGTTFATFGGGERATAKINAAIEAARRAP